jgi:hypothetical protein
MSPYPAGQAKTLGRTFRASSSTNVNPTILQACIEVKILGFKDSAKRRNSPDPANHNENTTIGVSEATATPSPNRPDPFLNRSKADAVRAATNQTTSSPAMIFPYLFIAILLVS